MRKSIWLLLPLVAVLMLTGCHKTHNPGKNLLPHSAYGWWFVEVPQDGIRGPHSVFLRIDKKGALLLDFYEGFSARAEGTYSFTEESTRKQGEFNLKLRGTAYGSDKYIGNWLNTVTYHKKGWKTVLEYRMIDKNYPMEFRYKSRDEDLVAKELTKLTLDMARRAHAQEKSGGNQ
jgi:hypothetical protein